jgi:hypothetical protein
LVTIGGELKLLLEGPHQLEISNNPGKGYEKAIPIPSFQLLNTEPPPIRFQLEVNEGLDFPRYYTTDIQVVEKLLTW